MTPQEMAINFATSLQHLPQLDVLARLVASLMLTGTHGQESVWDVANRVCDRYHIDKPCQG